MKAWAALVLLAVQADGAIELRWKLRKGDELRYRTSHKSTAEGAGVFLEKEMAITYAHAVTEVDERGVAILRCTYEALAVKASGIQNYEYDSRKDKEPPPDPGVRTIARLVGQSFTLKLSPAGRVTEVRGFDKILDALVKDTADPEAVRKALQQVFSDEATQSMMQQIYLPLPPEKVPVGNAWTNEISFEFPVVGRVKLETKSTLAGVEAGRARIEQAMKMELKGEGGAPVKLGRFKGKASGLFSIERGIFLSSQAEIQMTVSSAGREMDIRTASEVRLVDR